MWKIRQPFKEYPEIIIIDTHFSFGELGKSKEHLLGYYYVQDISSMLSILALKPSEYNYISDSTTKLQGFIADELQDIVPHAVSGEKNAVDEKGKPIYQGVDASFLIPHLVSAIQELKAEVDSLKAQINGASA